MNNNISLYIGIDVSKEKHDICIKNHDGNLLKHFQITNTKCDLERLYAVVGKLRNDISDNIEVLFGMEATGIYYFPLYSALNRDGYSVKIYNPIQTYGYRKMEIRKTKTDLIDAAIIADMLRIHEPPAATAIDNLKLYQLRELCRVRLRNVEKRTKCKTQLIRNIDMVWPGYKSVVPTIFGKTSMVILKKYSIPSKVTSNSFQEFYETIKKTPRTRITRKKLEDIYHNAENVLSMPEIDSITRVEIKTLISEIELYDTHIQAIEKKIDQVMEQVNSKIKTVPGIGGVLGAMILGEIGDVNRFSSSKKLIAFAGLDPITNQSGRFENTTGPISKRGSPMLRYALFIAANVARRYDENLKRYYDKKIDNGKHHYSAVNATAAKLLRIIFWVLKNDKEYTVQLT